MHSPRSRFVGTIATCLLFAFAVGCTDDTAVAADATPSSPDAMSLATCDEACAYVAECIGFDGEEFGQDLASCTMGCENEEVADRQAVYDCLNGSDCLDPATVIACSPDMK